MRVDEDGQPIGRRPEEPRRATGRVKKLRNRKNPDDTIGLCPACGKQTFTSRGAARRAGRDTLPGEHINAYPCPLPDGIGFHYGHKPDNVVRGQVSITTVRRSIRETHLTQTPGGTP